MRAQPVVIKDVLLSQGVRNYHRLPPIDECGGSAWVWAWECSLTGDWVALWMPNRLLQETLR